MPLPFRRAARRTATFRSPTTLHKPRSSTRRPVVNGTGVPSAPGHRSRRRPVRGHPTRLSTITAATATISKPARLRCEEPRVSAAPLRWVAAVVAAATERSVKPRHSVRSSAHCAHRTARCLCRRSGRPLATSPHGPTARSSSADQRLARAGPPRPLNPISRRTTAMLPRLARVPGARDPACGSGSPARRGAQPQPLPSQVVQDCHNMGLQRPYATENDATITRRATWKGRRALRDGSGGSARSGPH